MSTVGSATRLRWVCVAAGVASVVGAVAVAPTALRLVESALDPYDAVAPRTLIARALASGRVAHEGVAQARGSLGLPDLPRLDEAPALLGETTRMRVWWSSSSAWRVDTITANGETGTYGLGSDTVVWDFEESELTTIVGADGVRLPRAEDLLPPQVARRVLDWVGADDRVEVLPDKWVAGRTAAGVRAVSADPRSTIGHVDTWLDPKSGLPLEVHVVNTDGRDALVSTYLDVDLRDPAAEVLVPPAPSGVDRDWTSTPDIAAAIDERAPWLLPETLTGLPVSRSVAEGTATYGLGMVRFTVLPLPPQLADDVLRSSVAAGAAAFEVTGGDAALVRSNVLNGLVVRADDRQHAYVLAGFVTPKTLETAAAELLADPPRRRV